MTLLLQPSATHIITGCAPLRLADASVFRPPRFEDYKVAVTAARPVAPLAFDNDPRTKIVPPSARSQAEKGPNFAGHYTIIGWGCGSSCLNFAIVDATSGHITFPEAVRNISTTHVEVGEGEQNVSFNGLRYRVDSSLLIVLGAVNEDDTAEGIRYYRWTGAKLTLIRFIERRKRVCR